MLYSTVYAVDCSVLFCIPQKAEMVAALAQILHLGCSFIVGGRAEADGHFLTLEDVLKESGLPDSMRGQAK